MVYGDMSAAWSDWLTAFHESLSKCGLALDREAFALKCDGFFERPEPPNTNDGLTIYERRIRALCSDLGVNLSNRELQQTATACAGAWQRYISLDPEAIPVLKALGTKKTLALISNFDHPPHIRSVLAELDLTGFFETIVISGEGRTKKPDPQIFFTSLQHNELQAEDVAYVGDTADDMQGARAAGMVPILIQRNPDGEHHSIADFTIDESPSVQWKGNGQFHRVKTIQSLAELIEMFG